MLLYYIKHLLLLSHQKPKCIMISYMQEKAERRKRNFNFKKPLWKWANLKMKKTHLLHPMDYSPWAVCSGTVNGIFFVLKMMALNGKIKCCLIWNNIMFNCHKSLWLHCSLYKVIYLEWAHTCVWLVHDWTTQYVAEWHRISEVEPGSTFLTRWPCICFLQCTNWNE